MKFLVIALVVIASSYVECADQVGFVGNLVGKIQIVNALCNESGNRQALVDGFYGCYTEPSKTLFDQCQVQVFGHTLNTVANVDATCSQPDNLASYENCLENKFQAANQNMNEVVTTLNACQARALGI